MFLFCSIFHVSLLTKVNRNGRNSHTTNTRIGLDLIKNSGIYCMMRLKVEKISEGLHPSETIVSIRTVSGAQRVVVSTRSIDNSSIPVGWPLGTMDQTTLVELPRETEAGAWRVRVPSDQLIEIEERMRA
jgi:hypothetical protein